jgi:Fur family ferric uptake transcriptional regulator
VTRKEIEEKLHDYLVKNKLKSTSQRDAIIDALLAVSGKHVTIEELLNAVRKKNPNVGYATVYRTLMLLVDAEIVSQRHFGEGQSLFELADEHHHDHIICTQCNRIIEFENENIERLQEKVAEQFKFTLSGHRMELYGICEGMKQKGVCSYEKKRS